MTCNLVYRLTTHMWLAPEFIERLLDECITSPISGFHVTEFPLWKLGYLLDENWLEEDVLNALAELCYFRITADTDCADFVYLPTLAFNDARQLYNSQPRIYGPNLTAFRQLLHEEFISTIGFGVWHNNHYHGFRYDSTSGTLVHGDSQHGSAPDDVLPIMNWLLASTRYPRPSRISNGHIRLQGINGGVGSCAIAAHNFIECRQDNQVPQWDPVSSEGFRDKSLMDLVIYHCKALDSEVRASKCIHFFSSSADDRPLGLYGLCSGAGGNACP